jgi:hypothetical protein
MKKSAVAALWISAVSLVVLFNFGHVAEANSALPDRSLSLQGLAIQLPTPEAIVHFLWKNFNYEKDERQFGNEDYWQTPEEFVANRKGDCEDFAVFAHQILKMQGVQSFLINIYGNDGGHTICVFKENGKYQAIDGTDVRRFNADSLNDVIRKINPFWQKSAIVEPTVSHRAEILSEFSNPSPKHFLGIF